MSWACFLPWFKFMKAKIFSHPELITEFPEEIKLIFKIFDGQIRLVGGCVRDLLLNKKINDFDFATKVLPEEIIKILKNNNLKAIPTGLKHGTVTAIVNNKNFEITTLRKDLKTDGRHAVVEFVDDYFFDAARRDFTINALYLDSKGLLYDYFDGISDLENRKVKFIGDASQRIEEDFLRILRFFRFSCNYAAELDDKGLKACILQKENIKFLSSDRIRGEIFKVFSNAKNSDAIKFFKSLEDFKIREELFLDKFNIDNLKKISDLEEKLQIKFEDYLKFFLLIASSKTSFKEIFSRLNFSSKNKKYFEFLSKNNFEDRDIIESLAFFEKNLVRDIFLVKLVRDFTENDALKIKNTFKLIDDFILPIFPINGDDVKACGLEREMVGEFLMKAKIFWIKNNFKPSKIDLIKFLKSKIKS